MHRALPAAALLAAALALPATAAAQTQPAVGQWTFSLTGGADFVVDGDVHGGANAPIADLGALNPALAGVPATLQIGSRSWDDVYGEIWGVTGEFGYGMSPTGELFGAVGYQRSGRGSLQVGTAAVPALAAELPVFGEFGRFEAWSLEAGYRQYFAPAGAGFRPWAAVRGGLQFVDSINATFTIPDGGITLANVPFYDDSTIFTVGLDVGVLISLTPGIEFGAQTGLYYADKLKDNDSAIGGLGLAAINDEGSRLSIPVRAVLRARF